MPGAQWPIVWVIGASTGIGRELAVQLAARGSVVAVSARSAEKLRDMPQDLPGKIHAYPVDVTDAGHTKVVADTIARELGPIDLVICAAGRYRPLDATAFDVANFTDTMTVNYLGVIHVLANLLPMMRARGKGHVAWIASVAGLRGLPKAAAYGPSKAALINLAESLKPELERDGITVSVINPGFVATPMTEQNDFPMPFIMTPRDAAARAITGLEQGKFEIAFPRRFSFIIKIGRVLPYRLYFWIIRTYVAPAPAT
jgi:short-subunit dehydrogenase